MQTIDKSEIRTGQILRVHQQITEGAKSRIQVFEGTVIKRKGGKGNDASFTIRKKSGNVWVEKIFPVHLPAIEKVELVKEFKKRRAQLTFLRNERYKKKLQDITEKIWGNKDKKPKAEEPKVEEPKAEEPKAEEPKVEEPKS